MTTSHAGSKILVPLDGSAVVRAALGPAADLAAASHGELVLLIVVTSAFERSVQRFDELEHVTPEQTADRYLRDVESSLTGELDDLTISHVVRSGEDPTSMILSVANEVDATMIAMTSHGHTGFKKLLLGSIAKEILDRAKVPVLLVPTRSENED